MADAGLGQYGSIAACLILGVSVLSPNRFQPNLKPLFSDQDNRGSVALVYAGVAASLGYVFVELWASGAVKSMPEKIMILTFFISIWKFRHSLKSDRVFQLMIVAMILPPVLLGANMLFGYDNALRYYSSGELIPLFLFLALAWWFGGEEKLVLTACVLLFLGLILTVSMAPELEQTFTRIMELKRVDFGIHNAQHASLLFGIVVIFCVTHFNKLVGPGALRWQVGLFVAALVGVAGLMATQTRAIYLGLIVCSLIAIGMGIRSYFIDKTASKLIYPFLGGGLILAIVLVASLGTMGAKMEKAQLVVTNLAAQGLHAVPFNSAGVRIHFWAESLTWIAQKPLAGWGRKVRREIASSAEHFPERWRRLGHPHNSYIELLLGYGIIGLLFFLGTWALLLKRIRSTADPETWRFVFYGSVFFFIVNCFESYIFYWSGKYVFAVMMGIGYTSYLAKTVFHKPADPIAPQPG